MPGSKNSATKTIKKTSTKKKSTRKTTANKLKPKVSMTKTIKKRY